MYSCNGMLTARSSDCLSGWTSSWLSPTLARPSFSNRGSTCSEQVVMQIAARTFLALRCEVVQQFTALLDGDELECHKEVLAVHAPPLLVHRHLPYLLDVRPARKYGAEIFGLEARSHEERLHGPAAHRLPPSKKRVRRCLAPYVLRIGSRSIPAPVDSELSRCVPSSPPSNNNIPLIYTPDIQWNNNNISLGV